MKSQVLTTRLFSALAALAVVAAGCQGGSSGTSGVRSAGAIVMSPDDSHLYIADTDNDQVVVVNAALQKAEKTIKVGHWPERVQVGLDGRLFVSNRQDRSVSVVNVNTGTEVTRIPVGTEPLGMALSQDGRTLAVANLTSNSVSLIDTKSLTVTKTISTAANPTGVALVDDKLYVTHAKTGLVSVFGASTGTELTATPLSLGIDPSQTGGENRLPGQPVDPVFSNGRLYIAQVLSKQDPTPTPLTTAASMGGNAYAGGSTPGSVAVVANGVATIDTGTNTVLHGQGLEAFSGPQAAPVPSPGAGGTGGNIGAPPSTFDAVPPVIMTTLNGQPMSGASAGAIEPSGRFLYLTNLNSSNVAIVATDGSLPSLANSAQAFGSQTSNGVWQLVKVGAGPKGIAIPTTGDRAFVYNSFDETVSVLGSQNNQIQQVSIFRVSTSPLTPEQQLGRKLFHSADDSRMTNSQAGGISCASCHPNGRDDGRTWKFTEGNRNTPTLAGRDLMATAPYHWDGTLKSFDDFKRIVHDRMGGSAEDPAADSSTTPLTSEDFNAIFAYLQSLPGPDNPNLNTDGTPVNADAVARGKVVFEGKAQCASCHAGPDHTDNAFHNVGTEGHLTDQGTPELFPNDVNTPPLHELFYSAPYLHDGSIATLEDRLNNNPGDQHGITSTLSDQEKSDLVAYLKTL